jgi:hypothetical protein
LDRSSARGNRHGGRGYDSSINRLVMIAFILAFIAGLLAIMY